MTLADLGYNEDLKNHRIEQGLDSFGVGRVITEHKEKYIVKTDTDQFEAEVIGNLRLIMQIFFCKIAESNSFFR